jgi:hypothetical protein
MRLVCQISSHTGGGSAVAAKRSSSQKIMYLAPTKRDAIHILKKLQATWEDAQRACKEIDNTLLAVEYDEKDRCMSQLFQSNIFK